MKSKNVLAYFPPYLSNEASDSTSFPKGNMANLGWKEVMSRCQPRDSTVLLPVLCTGVSRWFLPCSLHGSSHTMCAVWISRTSSFFPAPHHPSLALNPLWTYSPVLAPSLLMVTWQHCPADPSICWAAEARSSHTLYSTRGTYCPCFWARAHLFGPVWQCLFAIFNTLYSVHVRWICPA